MRVRFALAVLLLAVFSTPAFAVEPDEVLDDPVLEERARKLGRELRCITCQSENIDDSNAPLARDLRLIVRERLVAGDTDEEIMVYVTDRYGDYVRLKPEMRADTALLWLTPALALVAGLGAAVFTSAACRSRKTVRVSILMKTTLMTKGRASRCCSGLSPLLCR